MKRLFAGIFFLAASSLFAADDFLDSLDSALTISTFDDQLRARLSGLLDLEYYNFPQPAPGLIRADGHDLFNPRLSLFLDAQIGPQLYFFAESRLDRGFDPSDRGAQLRADEYALRWTPWSDGRFNLQVGKFSTVVGNWVARHSSWDNPFVDAPAPYEVVTLVSDLYLPVRGDDFRAVPPAAKYEFLPIIWGPVYAEGVSASGRVGLFDYAVELKNAPLASRPDSWDRNFSDPAVDLRVGLHPNEAWNFGLSAAEGPYLAGNVYPVYGPATPVGDEREVLLGEDVSYARGHWQLWGEAFEARFQVPRVGDANVFAYYLETKYKFTPQLFAALRWNQEFFGSEYDGVATPADLSRVDLAVAYRFTPHTQLKLQYSLGRGDFLSDKLNSSLAAQFTIRF